VDDNGTHCPNCRRPFEMTLTPEQVSEKLNNLEPIAVTVLEKQLASVNETTAQRAAKLLLEWSRGKPQTTIHQTVDQVTAIRYESAAWMPEAELPATPPMSSDPPLLTSGQ
jgi:hypothetical protein